MKIHSAAISPKKTRDPIIYCYTREISPSEVARVWFSCDKDESVQQVIERLHTVSLGTLRTFIHDYAPPRQI